MAERHPRVAVTLSLFAAALTGLAACATSRPGPATPSDPSGGQCADVQMTPGDGGFYLSFGWDQRSYRAGESGLLRVCLGGSTACEAQLTGPTGCRSPRRQRR